MTTALRHRQAFTMQLPIKDWSCQHSWACMQSSTQSWRDCSHHCTLQLATSMLGYHPQKRFLKIGSTSLHDVCMQIMEISGARTASKAELEAVHSPAHIADMRQKALQDAPCVVADFEETPDNTTYMAKSSFDDALQARMELSSTVTWQC